MIRSDAPVRVRTTRRTALGLSGGALGAALSASCTAPWARPVERLRVVALPSPTPARYGSAVLRVVLSPEGLPALDTAVRDVVEEAARSTGARLEVQELGAFASSDSVAHRLLVSVQAGVPPDALLLLGRQAQTARFRASEVTQDVSALLRPVWRQQGPNAKVAEVWCAVAGSWHGVPYYQRLIGHWARPALMRPVGVDLGAAASAPTGAAGSLAAPNAESATYAQLAQALDAPRGASGGTPGAWPWGIGAADSPDTDAWVWTVVNAWGGGLADLKGERVDLATPPAIAAIEWLAAAIRRGLAQGRIPPQHAEWTDTAKNGALLTGQTAYTYTERLLDRAPAQGIAQGEAAGAGELAYLMGVHGPAARPHVAGAGAVWFVPRGAQADLAQSLVARLLEPASQARVWTAGQGMALPAFQQGWDGPALATALSGAPGGGSAAADAQRFRLELDAGGSFYSATGNGGPETPPSQALAEGRLGAAMLRQAVAGRPAPEVVAEAADAAVAVYRAYGFPGQ